MLIEYLLFDLDYAIIQGVESLQITGFEPLINRIRTFSNNGV